MKAKRNKPLTSFLCLSGGPFTFPLGLVSAVKTAVAPVSLVTCGDAGVAFFFLGGGVVLVKVFCGVLMCALVFCAGVLVGYGFRCSYQCRSWFCRAARPFPLCRFLSVGLFVLFRRLYDRVR